MDEKVIGTPVKPSAFGRLESSHSVVKRTNRERATSKKKVFTVQITLRKKELIFLVYLSLLTWTKILAFKIIKFMNKP